MKKLTVSYHPKPVSGLLAVAVLLALAILLFFHNSKPVAVENTHNETSEGAGSFHSPLMCV